MAALNRLQRLEAAILDARARLKPSEDLALIVMHPDEVRALTRDYRAAHAAQAAHAAHSAQAGTPVHLSQQPPHEFMGITIFGDPATRGGHLLTTHGHHYSF